MSARRAPASRGTRCLGTPPVVAFRPEKMILLSRSACNKNNGQPGEIVKGTRETAEAGNWIRNVVLFLVSQTVSLFGSALVQYAIFWHVTLATESGLMMTIYITCGFVPTFFLSPLAGVWADRYDRRMLIAWSDALIAAATLLLAVLLHQGYDAIWLYFAMSAVRAVGTGIRTPAVSAILPQMVPEEHLTRVNGINSSIQAVVNLLSPMISAALFTATSMQVIFLVDVVTAAIAIFILVAFLNIPVHAKALQGQTTGYFSDLKQGFQYIKHHPFLKQFFLFFAVFFVLVSPSAFLTPLQVVRSFGDDVWRLTAIEIAFSAGMMLGGIIMASWGGFENKVHTMAVACFVQSICTFALGVVPVFWIYLVFMGLIGVIIPVFNTPSTVLLQEKVEEDYLGRVFGLFTMISTSMMPMGMLGFGPVADIIPIEWLLVGTGALMFMQSIFLLNSKSLVAAGERIR